MPIDVVAAEHLDEQPERLLDELEPVLAGHRARHVDDERQRRRRPGVVGDVAGLDADPEERLVRGEERGRAAVGVDGERVVLGRGVALVEVVDELLDPDARRIGQVAVVDEPPGDGVGGRVDVEPERRLVVDAGGRRRDSCRVRRT